MKSSDIIQSTASLFGLLLCYAKYVLINQHSSLLKTFLFALFIYLFFAKVIIVRFKTLNCHSVFLCYACVAWYNIHELSINEFRSFKSRFLYSYQHDTIIIVSCLFVLLFLFVCWVSGTVLRIYMCYLCNHYNNFKEKSLSSLLFFR